MYQYKSVSGMLLLAVEHISYLTCAVHGIDNTSHGTDVSILTVNWPAMNAAPW
jgi:hypothetical protein